MRAAQIIFLVLLNTFLYSQHLRYIRLGQNFRQADATCLVIKYDRSFPEKLSALPHYSAVKHLKLIGFNEDARIDTVLPFIMRWVRPQTLVFEGCDLEGLADMLPAVGLEQISIMKHSLFQENTLFHVLKNNPVKKLVIQQAEQVFFTDSMCLLPALEEIRISNTSNIEKANKTQSIRILVNGNAHDIQMVYCGDLYKGYQEEQAPNIIQQPVYDLAEFSPIHPKPYSCIRQPLADVNINDTLYFFDPARSQAFSYGSGSKMLIDANAFLTQDNEAYTGTVRLFYREFRNPVEILLSGIPMKNTVNGEEKLFKSGGMYEIRAFDKRGNELKTRSDTSVKINFALTDTSSDFEFFSLKNDGSWETSPSKVISVLPDTSRKRVPLTRAVQEYLGYFNQINRNASDTAFFSERFSDTNYLYVYRRDNFEIYRDSCHYSLNYPKAVKLKGFFRVKYLKQTQDKKILFTLAENLNTNFRPTPRYLRITLNKIYIYTGPLTKEEFRKKFHHKLYGWDMQCSESGNTILMVIKTTHTYETITCQVATEFPDGSYKAVENSGKQFAGRFNRLLAGEARNFNKTYKHPIYRGRFYSGDFNNIRRRYPTPELAYQYSKKFQTPNELLLDLESWKAYVKRVAPDQYTRLYDYANDVGTALVKTGMGIKNIDCYIHSGEMEKIFVNYKNVDLDTLPVQYHAMLYKDINTSYNLTKNYQHASTLEGYYFKNHANYIIRFSDDGFMQVTKPQALPGLKTQNEISLAYKKEYAVKGLNSNQITQLILE